MTEPALAFIWNFSSLTKVYRGLSIEGEAAGKANFMLHTELLMVH